jgi:hypothetical protein
VVMDAPAKRLPANESARMRQHIIDDLRAKGGRYVVLVHLEDPVRRHFTWVYNDARIDESPVVWAWDMGVKANERLAHYFKDRQILLMTDRASDLKIEVYAPPGTSRATP